MNYLKHSFSKIETDVNIYLNEFSQKMPNSSAAFCLLRPGSEIISIGDDTLLPAASTLKVAESALFYLKHSNETNKEVEWSEIVNDAWKGSSSSADVFTGILSINDILAHSLIYSDNLCADFIQKYVGGPSNVESFLKEIGCNKTFVKSGYSPNEIFSTRSFLENISTGRDAAKLLRYIWENKYNVFNDLIKLMYNTKNFDKIPRYISGPQIAHKSGCVCYVYSDIGIINFKKEPFALTFYSNGEHLEKSIKTDNPPIFIDLNIANKICDSIGNTAFSIYKKILSYFD